MTEQRKRSKATLGIIVVLIVLITGFGAYGFFLVRANESSADLTQQQAETKCQDQARAKLTGENVTIVNNDDYAPMFAKSTEKASDNSDTYMLSWNGKDKDGKTIAFACTLSGNGDAATVKALELDSKKLI